MSHIKVECRVNDEIYLGKRKNPVGGHLVTLDDATENF